MSTWSTTVSAEAWKDLVMRYRQMIAFEEPDDQDLADLLRNKIMEVEGE